MGIRVVTKQKTKKGRGMRLPLPPSTAFRRTPRSFRPPLPRAARPRHHRRDQRSGAAPPIGAPRAAPLLLFLQQQTRRLQGAPRRPNNTCMNYVLEYACMKPAICVTGCCGLRGPAQRRTYTHARQAIQGARHSLSLSPRSADHARVKHGVKGVRTCSPPSQHTRATTTFEHVHHVHAHATTKPS